MVIYKLYRDCYQKLTWVFLNKKNIYIYNMKARIQGMRLIIET